MRQTLFRGTKLITALTLTILSGAEAFGESTPPVTAQSSETSGAKAAKIMRYLKPSSQKTDLNEGQDRNIKQRTFKAGQNVDVHGVFNPEIGVYAVVSKSELKDDEALKKLLESNEVAGLSVLIAWSDIETKDGEYDWSAIENTLKHCKEHDKYLILRISTCGLDSANQTGDSDTPNFVYEAGCKSISYKGSDGKDHRMPIFWDKTYLAKWANFVKAMGEKFDKNESLHSVGITGGGVLGGTAIVPDFSHTPANYAALEQSLSKEHGMTSQKIIEHWKYVGDLFPKSFEKTRLNFDINAPIQSRSGQTMLDEISDYLVYRYGERVFITRQNIGDSKHGFDQYRVILKLKNDTYTGYALTEKVADTDLAKISKNSLNDGISFIEIPGKYFADENASIKPALENLKNHLGYQIGCTQAKIDSDIKCGEPIKASFTFSNFGSSALMRPSRNLDKDVPGSYQIGLELKDEAGKSIVLSLATPSVPTTQWFSGKPVNFSSSFRLSENMKPGVYSVSLSLINKETKKSIRLIDSRPQNDRLAAPDSNSNASQSLFLGKLKVS